MKRYWLHMVKSTEKTVAEFLEKQILDGSFEDGRMPSEILEGKHTIYLLTDAVCVYCCQDSSYYHDPAVLKAIRRGLAFVARWQRADGSLDYPSCNFFSAPDTAFCFRRLFGAYGILCKYGSTEEETALAQQYLELLLRCMPIFLYGGFHTPNHRWAVCASLFQCANLVKAHPGEAMAVWNRMRERFPAWKEASGMTVVRPMEPAGEAAADRGSQSAADRALQAVADRAPQSAAERLFAAEISTAQELEAQLRKRADQYLNEGIDGNEEGEYAERSTGNYNAVVDKSLISMYEETGNEAYLGFVERNLQMMLYYFDGDDTIFTQNSLRQDHGRALYADQYFYLYTYMAEKTGNELFDRAAHKIIKDNLERGDRAQDAMYIFLLYDWLLQYTFQGYGYLDTYRKFFRGSSVLRVKKKTYGYSVLNGKASFLFLKFGSLPVGLRIGESYCEIRSFVSQKMEVTEDGCRLSMVKEGWFYEPWEEKPETSDWWEMDHSKRKLAVTSRLLTEVSIRELENGLEITVRTEGLKGLPMRVEIQTPAGCYVENESFCLKGGKGEGMILRGGYVNLHKDGQQILIGPGYGTHAFGGHYSGEEHNENGYTITLNEYTPYTKTFRIEAVQKTESTVCD